MSIFGVRAHAIFLVDNTMVRRNECCENELMLLGNVVTRRVSEENASDSSLTRRVTKHGHLLLAALGSVTASIARLTLHFTSSKFNAIEDNLWLGIVSGLCMAGAFGEHVLR